MTAPFNLGTEEFLILAVGGIFCTGVVVVLGVLVFLLTRRKDEARND